MNTSIIDLLEAHPPTVAEKTSKYQIYCDMDGVLCDFDARFKELNPEKLSAKQYQDKYGIEKFWNYVINSIVDRR